MNIHLFVWCGDLNLQTLLCKTVDLGSQFIWWWVSSQSYRLRFKHRLDSLTIKNPYGSQPNTLFPLDLASCFLCSHCSLLPSCLLPLLFLFFPPQKIPLICLPLLSYIIPPSGVQIITFHRSLCNPTFTHNP